MDPRYQPKDIAPTEDSARLRKRYEQALHEYTYLSHDD